MSATRRSLAACRQHRGTGAWPIGGPSRGPTSSNSSNLLLRKHPSPLSRCRRSFTGAVHTSNPSSPHDPSLPNLLSTGATECSQHGRRQQLSPLLRSPTKIYWGYIKWRSTTMSASGPPPLGQRRRGEEAAGGMVDGRFYELDVRDGLEEE